MAKLNVTYPAVDVMVNGQAYRKVDRKAQACDIVKITGTGFIDVETGSFYAVESGAKHGKSVDSIVDDGGTFRWGYLSRGDDWEVYEAVAGMAAAQYREVKRKANVGERIKIVDAFAWSDYKNGDEFDIVHMDEDGDIFIIDNVGDREVVASHEYVVLEPVNTVQPTNYAVGDYVKVIDASGDHKAQVGDIAVVTNANWHGLGTIIDVKTLDGRTLGMYKTRFAPATPEEVAAAQAEANRKIAVGPFAGGGFAQIVDADKSEALIAVGDGDFVKVSDDYGYAGRFALKATRTDGKYGFCNADALRQITEAEYTAATQPKAPEPEFNVGDKIRITRNQSNWPVGTVATITEVLSRPNHDSGTVRARALETTYLADGNCFELLTAEEVAAIEKEAQEAARWAKIARKVGEFKRGDIVRVTRPDYVGIGEVEDVGNDGYYSVGVRFPNGDYRGAKRNPAQAEIVVPVEQRFDKTQEAA